MLRGAVDSSLYVAVNAAGGTDRLAVELADVFKYDIDFVNQVQPGDSFIVAHEQQYQDGEFVRDGDILAAEFTNSGKTYRAVRYVGPNGRADYYTPDGRPVRKAFLRYPVDYARISSGFSLARRHPVLNRVRAHKGIDFAAATARRSRRRAAGRIVSRGRNGGYGNAVVLAHNGGITTLYGHMSRFAKGLKVGDRVSAGPGDRLRRHDGTRLGPARALRVPRQRRAQESGEGDRAEGGPDSGQPDGGLQGADGAAARAPRPAGRTAGAGGTRRKRHRQLRRPIIEKRGRSPFPRRKRAPSPL